MEEHDVTIGEFEAKADEMMREMPGAELFAGLARKGISKDIDIRIKYPIKQEEALSFANKISAKFPGIRVDVVVPYDEEVHGRFPIYLRGEKYPDYLLFSSRHGQFEGMGEQPVWSEEMAIVNKFKRFMELVVRVNNELDTRRLSGTGRQKLLDKKQWAQRIMRNMLVESNLYEHVEEKIAEGEWVNVWD